MRLRPSSPNDDSEPTFSPVVRTSCACRPLNSPGGLR